MKIGYFYRNLDQGGIQRIIVNAVNHFAQNGHELTVILMIPGGDYVKLLDERIKVVCFRSRKKTALLSSFVEILRQERFDLVFTATPSLNTFALAARLISRINTKIIISEHNNTAVFFKNSKLTLSKLTFLSIPILYRFADAIVAVSKGLGDSLQKIALVPHNKIHVIYNPAWLPEFNVQRNTAVDHQWLNDDDIPVIITVGRLVKAKNHELLINAVAQLNKKRKVRLVILGDGPLNNSLQEQISALGLTDIVRLEGFKMNPVSYISKANVFALSSDYEGFGVVLVEALSTGITIVSTDCDYGPSEILDNNYGYLVPVGNVNAMAEKLDYALDYPLEKEMLVKRAREFGADNIMEQYQGLFASVVS